MKNIIIAVLLLFISVDVHSEVLLDDDFEDADSTCWSSRPDSGGAWNAAGCGGWEWIGSGARISLNTNSAYAHSGSKSIKQTFTVNEDTALADHRLVPVLAYTSGYDHIYVSFWHFFTDNASGEFDHGYGHKVARFRSYNGSSNAFDIVSHVRRNTGTPDQSPTPDPAYGVDISFNGGPYDWGAASHTVTLNSNTWYNFEYEIQLNTVGLSDGIVRLWIDGVLVVEGTGKNIRASNDYVMNYIQVGGWYSNGGGSNPTPNPSPVSYRYIDDFIISTERIDDYNTDQDGSGVSIPLISGGGIVKSTTGVGITRSATGAAITGNR